MSEAVICTVPQPYALASSTTLRNSSVAMPRRRYLGSVYMLDNKPILPLGHPKYGGFSTNDMPLVPTILSSSTASHATNVPSFICLHMAYVVIQQRRPQIDVLSGPFLPQLPYPQPYERVKIPLAKSPVSHHRSSISPQCPYPHSVAPARRLDGCPKQPEAMSLFLVRKQMMQQRVPVIDERCGDAVGVGILVVARENAIVVELKNLCAR